MRAADLKEAALTGARLSAFAQVAIEIVGFAGGVALARLIAPAEFGLVAVALILPAIALGILLEGIAAPVVQRRELSRAHLEVAVLLSLALGLCLSAVAFLLLPPAGSLIFGEESAGFLQLASPVFLLVGLRAVPFATLQRQLDFRRLTRVEVLSRLSGSGAAVALAFAGVGGEAIVIGALVTAAASALLLAAASPLVIPRWHMQEARELLGFGAPASVAAVTHVAMRNADYAILAAKLSAAQVGFYWRGYQLGVEYQSKLTTVMLRVAFPTFSRAQDDDQVRSLRLRITRVHSSAILPLLAVFIVAAPTFVPWVYGPVWEPAVLPAQLLAVAGMAIALTKGIGAIVLAIGNPKTLVVWNGATLLLLAACVTWASEYGLTAACLGVVGANLASMVGAYFFLLNRQLGIPLVALLAEVVPGVVMSGIILALGIPAGELLAPAQLPAPVFLALVVVGSGLLYVLTLPRLFPAAWKDLSMLAGRLVGRSRATPHPEAAQPAPTEAAATVT